MRDIKLSKGFIALVDDEDFERLNQYKWHVVSNSAKHENRVVYYARRFQPIGSGEYALVFMHREIMGLKPSDGRRFVVDHKDYNGLNNQKDNLQIVIFSQNLKNKRTQQRKRRKINS